MAANDAYEQLNELLRGSQSGAVVPDMPPSEAGSAADTANALLAGPQALPPKPTQPFPWYARAAYGLADPMVGLAQLGFHATPWSGGFDQLVSDRQKSYEQQREAAGQTGVDWARLGGNIGSPVNFVPATRAARFGELAPAWLGTPAEVAGLTSGAFTGLAQPVTPAAQGALSAGDFLGEKAAQTGLGGITGAAAGPVSSVLTGATNPDVAALQAAGVVPRPGQAGGVVARLMEGLESKTPIVKHLIPHILIRD
jgi:hypothetical protein